MGIMETQKPQISLFTNRYKDFKPTQGIPVRITYGKPKWRLPYDIKAQAKLVTPGYWFMQGTDEEFTERYCKMLDDNGYDRILNELYTIADLNHDNRLVLLCFDDVRKGLCHRSLFAKWWQKQTGMEVKELQSGLNVCENVLF